MELNPQETRDGTRWFFGAGAAAVLLSVFLQYTDFRLTTSDSEIVKGKLLEELRTAQASVAGRATDSRQTATFLLGESKSLLGESKSLVTSKQAPSEEEATSDEESNEGAHTESEVTH